MMTEFERDILRRVIGNTDIDIDNILDISEAKTLNDNFRKNPDQYRDKISIPLRSLKTDIDEFWDDYFSGKPLYSWYNYILKESNRSSSMNEKKDVLEMNDMWQIEVYELQKSLQNSFIRQKNLIERIDELNNKVAILGGDPNQLELKF